MSPNVWRILIAAGVAALAIGFGGLAVVNEFRKPLANKDYPIWYNAGVDAMAGDDIYAIHLGTEMNFTYPPFAATCFYGPASLLGNHGFIIVMVLVQTLAWMLSILFSVKLATGSMRGAHPLLYALPALVTLPGVWTSYQLGQANLMLLPLMLGGFVLLNQKGKLRWLAGGLFAMAAAFKAFPVLVVVYLIWRRQWLALGGFVIGLAVCLLLLPGLIRGFDTAWQDMHTWTTYVMLTSDADQIGQRHASWAYNRENQSLQASVIRLLHAMPFDHHHDQPRTVNVVELGFDGARLGFLLLGLLLAVGQALLMPRKRDATAVTNTIEQGMIICLITIGSPLAWGYYFIWMLFPLTVGLHHVGDLPDGRRRLAWLAWWFAVALLPLVAFDVGVVAYLHAAGTATWACVGLWAGLGVWLWQKRCRSVSSSF